ncbi:MAG: hypothetical protein M3Q80_02730, partial [bacterium]|nr:hypothetical protein [bacterium]
MREQLIGAIQGTFPNLGITEMTFGMEYPENPEHGDFSSNVAMVNAKKLGIAPKILAEKIVAELEKNKPENVESIHVAGPGFINFKIKDTFFVQEVISAHSNQEYGWGSSD